MATRRLRTDNGFEEVFLTYEEVARRWKCSKATVRRHVKRGVLETIGKGGLIRVTLQSVIAYEDSTRQQRRAPCHAA